MSDPNKGDTQSLARNHIVHVSKSNLITIAGGKWTTYRAMAQETIDAALKGLFNFFLPIKYFIYVTYDCFYSRPGIKTNKT